jgi:hypothetical protein
MGATDGTGTAYPSRVPPVSSGVRVALVFCAQHNLFTNSLIIYNIFLYVLYACSDWSLYYVNLLY